MLPGETENESHSQTNGSSEKSLGSAISDLLSSVSSLIRSELNLAKLELRETTTQVTKHVVQLAIFAAVALLGITPFMAFLVIGLGELLNDNYWLSALIVSLVCFAVGGIFAAITLKKIKQQDFSMRNTRETLNADIHLIDRKVDEMTQIKTRRAA
jgi:uncharacterized membrane protein YqjE